MIENEHMAARERATTLLDRRKHVFSPILCSVYLQHFKAAMLYQMGLYRPM